MNALLLAGFILACFLLTVRLGGLVCAYAGRRWEQSLARSSKRSAALALLPLALGVAVALSIVPISALVGACHCLSHPHHLHLCFEHAGFSWSLVTVVLAGLLALSFALVELSVLLAQFVRTHRWLQAAARPSEQRAGIAVALSKALGMRAVTAGLVKPRVVIGEALWTKLSADQREAVVAHEHAHAVRRDPMTLLVLSVVACLMPKSAGSLVTAWRRAAELACDAEAADAIGDRFTLADALVTCGRLQLAEQGSAPRGALAAAEPKDLEFRVKCLLDRAVPPSYASGGDLLRASAALLLVVLLTSLVVGPAAHHTIETLLEWTV